MTWRGTDKLSQVSISKDFRWEMGHRLPGHPLCQNLHGHSYRMRVEVLGEPNPDGMVMDYALLSDIVQPLINELDHCFLADESDTLLIEFLHENKFKTKVLPCRSTAENLSVLMCQWIRPLLDGYANLCQLTVSIHETEKTAATFSIALKTS